MSAPSNAPAASHQHPAEENKFFLFVRIAMILAVITGAELLVATMDTIPSGYRIAALTVLLITQFMLAIFFMMHLKWEKAFCTILFFIGIGLTGATVAAFFGLFGAHASLPQGPAYEQSSP
jgi:cytochrome c oxidase subunit 4